jgi:hypothetical protein
MRLRIAMVAGVTLLAACHRNPKQDPNAPYDTWAANDAGLPASLEGSLVVGRRAIDLGIYTAGPISSDALNEAKVLARTRLKGVTLLTSPDDEKKEAPPTVLVFTPSIDALPPPTVELIRGDGRGIRPADAEAIAASRGVIALVARFDDDPTLSRVHELQGIALDAARDAQGTIWDESTREIYSVAEWDRVRIQGWQGDLPEVRRHISLHYDDSTGHGRLVTLGMLKFGEPDLVFVGVGPTEVGAATRVLDTVAQLLVEGARVEPGGRLTLDVDHIRHVVARASMLVAPGPLAKPATATLTPAHAEQGDPENRLVEVHLSVPLVPPPPLDAGP